MLSNPFVGCVLALPVEIGRPKTLLVNVLALVELLAIEDTTPAVIAFLHNEYPAAVIADHAELFDAHAAAPEPVLSAPKD